TRGPARGWPRPAPISQAPHSALAEEPHLVGCMESSGTFPYPGGRMSPPPGRAFQSNFETTTSRGKTKSPPTGGPHAPSPKNNSRTADRGRRGLRNRKSARGHLRNSGGRAGGFAVGRISHRTRTLRRVATSPALGRGVDSVARRARLAALHGRT